MFPLPGKIGQLLANGIQRNVLQGISVAMGLERSSDRQRRLELFPVDLETLGFGVDAGFHFNWNDEPVSLDDEFNFGRTRIGGPVVWCLARGDKFLKYILFRDGILEIGPEKCDGRSHYSFEKCDWLVG